MPREGEESVRRSTPGMGRRFFLACLAVFSLFLSLPSALRAFFIRTFPIRTVEKDGFRFDPRSGTVYWKERNTREPYELLVDGLVEKPVRLSYRELSTLPQTKQVSDFHCVEGWSVRDVSWGGVRFADLLKKVKVRGEARYVIFHSLGTTADRPAGQDHYIESFPLGALLDPKKECLLALSKDGAPLSHDHGAPCRVVAPFDLGYKSIKYVARIEFSEQEKPGWWTLANPIYPVNAPVPRERLRKK